jgi:hypothetical protein
MSIKRRDALRLIAAALAGSSMPTIAGVANPRGPEGRPVIDRTIRFIGKTSDATARIAYPTPDDMVDRAINDSYVINPHSRVPLLLRYEYSGFFWQGRFGTVKLLLEVAHRTPGAQPWKGYDGLPAWVTEFAKDWNSRLGDAVWENPSKVEVNGVPCILLSGRIEGRPDEVRRYYFPFEEDYALLLRLDLVDNSNRPGLTKSNWRPRAEAFREQLLSTVRVEVKPKPAN